ncbi:MAG TPA: exodeoxyribonuclease VII small subunit [Gammaproteobacteria bacterium]|jgi:exodeoxyribonuclease VII small subunit|nr:exodeoxyribonuclease VII small subunit [Gammaproteobacteria bacterium]RTZ62216.1 MAG: exodeoxyribonuclease VII small subunit [Gammaproteobacteria bacterium]HBK75663.1 exodeoxyribonuclease VII small subunit [Gammaproteobacteria bacterium]HIB06414.1 exodeoxyribonuclease VII small subunit [Gammaproteobacteria bacterium]HIM98724.1 exodeoxyribonuclease VII small subunit [Gammaproteobacteria bacterium]|tara:strand:- start:2476 stop:2718 length:243 start_codon:yes stop_codon:yes gene_type:complete
MARQAKSRIGDFEKSLKELETIVVRMEEGDQSLEASLKDFERGMALAQICRSSLDAAEQKVQTLIEKNGELQTEPFEPQD